MLTEDTIKQIFFLSDKPRPDALMADEVDIVQFAQNIAAYVELRTRADERATCIERAAQYNRHVADLLAGKT